MQTESQDRAALSTLGFVFLFITRKVVLKELLQEMGEFDWLRKHVLQIDNAR